MQVIYKYPLTGPMTALRMPEGAEILCVQMQNDIPCVWALVNTSFDMETRRIMLVGTGHSVPAGCFIETYLGTIQMQGGALIFHVFDVSTWSGAHVPAGDEQN